MGEEVPIVVEVELFSVHFHGAFEADIPRGCADKRRVEALALVPLSRGNIKDTEGVLTEVNPHRGRLPGLEGDTGKSRQLLRRNEIGGLGRTDVDLNDLGTRAGTRVGDRH